MAWRNLSFFAWFYDDTGVGERALGSQAPP